MTTDSMKIYYDGQCPFCSRYVGLIRLRESVGKVELIDLRDNAQSADWLASRGALPDQGMTVEWRGELHYGEEAVSRLAMLSTPSTAFNRLNHAVFKHRAISSLLYPLLRAGRNATLLLLGRKSIHPDADVDRLAFQTLFSVMWGIFAFLHFLVYAYQFNKPIYLSTLLTPVLGLVLVFKPTSKRVFLVLFGTMVIDAWLHMPIYSNHTMIKNVLLLAMLMAGLWHWLRGKQLETIL